VLNDPHGGFGLFVFIWVVIAVINIAYARRR
jgi:cbb3-type cytochrome oxidase subunit 3